LRARLTVWYSVALLAILSVFAVVVVWQLERIGTRRVDRELDDLAATLANVLQDELTEMPNAAAAADEVLRTMAVKNRALAILDGQGRAMAADWNGLHLAGEPPRSPDGAGVWTVQTPAGAWRVRTRPESFRRDTFLLLVGAPLADVSRERREAMEAMAIGIPIVLIVAA